MAQTGDARLVDALAEVLGDSDAKTLFRQLLQEALQQLIEEEWTAVNGPRRATTSATAGDPGRCPHWPGA
jgi:hypothetical protein